VKGSQSVAELTVNLLRSDIFSTRCRTQE
jgi:hypothetical protein